MGSRVGSIAILIVIAGIVAAVVIVISRLDLLDTGEPDAPVMVVSLEEGELVLLNEPQSITVTISSGVSIATLELFVDDASVVSILPAYSADRGAWIGSFVWTPERLGFADVRIVALDEEGVESARTITVEVTDDQARVAAALRVRVLGIAPLQQIIAGASVRLAISATGNQPIERFDMLVDDEHVVSVTPVVDETGQYIAAIEWTPLQTGEVEVTIVAVDLAGRSESQTIPVIIIPQGGSVAAVDTDEPSGEGTPSESTEAPDRDESGVGVARIEFPGDGERFTLDANLSIDVELTARNVGEVASALLYLTPIAPDETLGSSILIHSSEGHGPGNYSERVTGVEQWIAGSGSYELQLVVFTPEDARYDDRIRIHVVAVADADQDPESDDEQAGPPSASDEVDLAIVTARQADDDPRRLNVSITNESSVQVERAEVLITIVDATDGAELASAAVQLDLEPNALVTIPLDLDLQPNIEVQALVLLESGADTDAGNNTLPITLTPPDDRQEQQEQQDVQEEDQAQQEEPAQAQPEPARPAPDLGILDVQATNDGYVLLTIINSGAGPAETFSIVISGESGEHLETINRRDGDAQPLAPGNTEILTSLQPHSGTITITVVLGGDVPEQELDNNLVRFEVGG